ncbi:MAG: DUF2336 domain-containing protein [Rhodospirillaceae bacterium]|nr:MAG: DUF2336 domain-containing protein [Rhodospirillaceae bacterium]
MAQLTQADIDRLMHDPSPESRAATMLRVGMAYGEDQLSEAERSLALAIMQAVLPEVEVSIRCRLSASLQHATQLDHNLALQLAKDVIDVAAPILTHSPALSEDDLLEVIRTTSPAHIRVISQRAFLSVAVTSAVIDSGDEVAVLRVAANSNAAINASGYHRILDQFPDNARINEALSERPALPIAIVERLTTAVTGKLLERLIQRYALPAQRISFILHHSREHFLLTSMAGHPAEELRDFAEKLEENGLLSGSLILRALAIGQFAFLLQALSVKSDIAIGNVRRLMADDGGIGQERLFDKCRLPGAYRRLFVELATVGGNQPAHRDGKPPAGWIPQAIDILHHYLEQPDPDQSLEQVITEVMYRLDGSAESPTTRRSA